jgi:hypothetical protein
MEVRKTMNKRINQLGCILLFICFISYFIPNVQANPSLYVSSYSISPDILQPGDTGLLTITITNGETSATNTDADYLNSLLVDQTVDTIGAVIENIYITPDGDGKQVVKASKNYEYPVEIAPGSSITIEFTVFAEKNLSNGIYTPLVHVDLESDSFQDVSFPIVVRVNDDSIDMITEEVPSSISIIGETDLSFLLVNNRQNEISNIQIIPEQKEDIEISPSKAFISTLSSLDNEAIHFSIIPKTQGNQTITFQCTYKNGENIHKQNFSFLMSFSSFYEVYPIIYSSPEVIKKDETKEIRLKVYNAKNEEINGVRITPITEAQITPNEYFIGSMDADDLYAVTFDISAANLEENKSYPISYQITFKQDNNIYSNIPITSSIIIQSAETHNGIEFIIAGVFIVLLAILLLGYFVLKKRRGRS